MDSTETILQYVKQNGQVSVGQLLEHVNISRTALYEELTRLTANGQLVKTGIPPKKVFYSINSQSDASVAVNPTNLPIPPVAGPVEPNKSVPDDNIPSYFPWWLKWILRYGFDAQVLSNRYNKINSFVRGDYEAWTAQKASRMAPEMGYNMFLRIWWGLSDALIWVAALVSVWLQKMWASWRKPVSLRGTSATSDEAISKRINDSIGIASLPTIARNDKVRAWLKIAGLLLLGGIIGYQLHRFPQNQSEPSNLQEQLSDTQSQLTDSRSQLIKAREESDHYLNQKQEQLSVSEDELSKTKWQLTKEQQQRKNLEQQIKAMQEESQGLQQKVSQLDQQNRAIQEQLAKARAELSSVIANEVKQSHKEQIASSSRLGGTPHNDTRIETTSQVGIGQIMDWTTQGVPSDEIIHRIKTSHSTYGLKAEDISYLREHGVSEEVIKAMRATVE
ncbi:MAG: hypothetical protein HY209_02410 [Candidatus Omnitrophica bacterium]|nr:hypothetical protein [Candidatus Omnitrophota bacterium]